MYYEMFCPNFVITNLLLILPQKKEKGGGGGRENFEFNLNHVWLVKLPLLRKQFHMKIGLDE